MSQPFDASRSLTSLEQDSTIIAVIEMSQAKWLVAAVVPGVERQPLKRLDADEAALLKLLHRWRNEAGQAGREIKRIVVAYEAGRDGFWLARWLRVRGVEAYVIHPASIAVSREHRRAKTDRLDTELLLRAFLGWLRGEKRRCSMVAIPTVEEEDVILNSCHWHDFLRAPSVSAHLDGQVRASAFGAAVPCQRRMLRAPQQTASSCQFFLGSRLVPY